MKNKIKRLAAAAAAVSIMSTASLSVSATTAGDVVAAARGAGLLEEYVQVLQNYLYTSEFSSDQYDVMIDALYGVGDDINKAAREYLGIKEPEEPSDKNNQLTDSNGNKTTTKKDENVIKNENFDDDFLVEIANSMSDENIVDILNKMIDAGKKLDLDITAEKKSDKSYILTVKDKDGKVQLITPVGKLVDTTGITDDNKTNGAAAAVSVTAVGFAGAVIIASKAKKNEE